MLSTKFDSEEEKLPGGIPLSLSGWIRHAMASPRKLVIVADDFGIGLPTSQGILDLAHKGRVGATTLIVNSIHAEEAVRQWRRAGGTGLVELGWHACLTLDRPLLRPRTVSSLVSSTGEFLAPGQLLRRVLAGRVVMTQVQVELQAQYERFQQLTGQFPRVVNGHHHIQVFPGISQALLRVLDRQQPRPYVRRVRETLAMLSAEKRGRGKRLLLSTLGRRACPALDRLGFPGNEYLIGISDPHGLAWPEPAQALRALSGWLTATPGNLVELMCHPGRFDEEARRCDRPSSLSRLLTRWLPSVAVECGPEVRVRELELLAEPSLAELFREQGYRLSRPHPLPAVARAA
jgi:predicted glycoside hydrolase/deacetylase ChbG (UPF0249 family)